MHSEIFLKRTAYLMLAAATAPLLSAASGLGQGASAQTNPAATSESENDSASDIRRLDTVFVEARRSEENLQDVPVVVQAFDAATLGSLAATDLAIIGAISSGLSINTNAITNPSISLRGLSANPTNTFGDTTVSINFDGIAHSNSQILRLSLFDAEAVEVLKGPQSLYFGKNSPGGIIAIRTKKPTTELFTEFQVGYEFEGEMKYGHGIISGPLTENWGGRLAVRLADQEGYFENIWGDGDPTATQPVFPKGPNFDEIVSFGTLLGQYERTTILAKVAYMDQNGSGQGLSEAIFCNSVKDNNPFEDCKLDGRSANEDFSGIPGIPSLTNRDRPTSNFDATQISLNVDHVLSQNWSLSSITGYFDSTYFYVSNSGQRLATLPLPGGLAFGRETNVELLSQELRLTGSFNRFNITTGVHVEERTTDGVGTVWLPPFLKLTPDQYIEYTNRGASVFAQADFDLTDTVNVSVGGRYSEEDVEYSGRNLDSASIPALGVPGELLIDPNKATFDNFSPEITVSYRPRDNLNFFASYREGFKSGGFGAATLSLAPTTFTRVPIDESFEQELVEGFEIGAKMELFDNTVRLNTALYSYDYDNLQVGNTIVTPEGGLITRTSNAGSASVNGFEADLFWVTPIDGLDITTNIAYNDNSYGEYFSPCNDFQIFYGPAGCDIDLDNNIATSAATRGFGPLVGTGFDVQNRNGDPLQLAPKWTGTAGFSYQRKISDNLVFDSTGLLIYSDEYQADGVNDPRAVQDSYVQLNGSIGISSADGKWDLKLIGRNLTDQLYALSIFSAAPGAGLIDEPQNLGVVPSQPRQVFLQFTYRPQGF